MKVVCKIHSPKNQSSRKTTNIKNQQQPRAETVLAKQQRLLSKTYFFRLLLIELLIGLRHRMLLQPRMQRTAPQASANLTFASVQSLTSEHFHPILSLNRVVNCSTTLLADGASPPIHRNIEFSATAFDV